MGNQVPKNELIPLMSEFLSPEDLAELDALHSLDLVSRATGMSMKNLWELVYRVRKANGMSLRTILTESNLTRMLAPLYAVVDMPALRNHARQTTVPLKPTSLTTHAAAGNDPGSMTQTILKDPRLISSLVAVIASEGSKQIRQASSKSSAANLTRRAAAGFNGPLTRSLTQILSAVVEILRGFRRASNPSDTSDPSLRRSFAAAVELLNGGSPETDPSDDPNWTVHRAFEHDPSSIRILAAVVQILKACLLRERATQSTHLIQTLTSPE